MKFKSINCLTRASKNQTKTERDENNILFNDSVVSIGDNIMHVKMTPRECLFVASCTVVKEPELRNKRPVYTVTPIWVKVVDGEEDIDLPADVTDILIVTSEIVQYLKNQDYDYDAIYYLFREKGMGQLSVLLSDVSDFTALIAQVVDD